MDYLLHMVDSSDWHALIQTSKKKSISSLRALYSGLNISYGAYKSLVDDIATEPPGSAFIAQKELLIEYYESAPSTLKKAIQARRNGHGLSACPFCGSPHAPNTLDHFLPKDLWPEYSIYPNNLVPQCTGCAPVKGARYYCNETLAAMFIHPMYSDLLSKVRFGVVVELPDGKEPPQFTIKFLAKGMLAEELARVKRHMEKMELRSRMHIFLRAEFIRWRRIVSRQGIDIRPAMEQRIAERVVAGDLPRDWKSAFCKGVLESSSAIEFFDALSARTRPAVVGQVEYEEIV